jgi:hypothetical protein
VTAKTKKVAERGRRTAKVSLKKASASEILAGLKVGRAEERRAMSAVASAKRSAHRVSGSVKRVSSAKRVSAPKGHAESK